MINKAAHFAGIDVGAEELLLVVRKNATSMKAQKFANTPAERARLVPNWSSCPGLAYAWRLPGRITWSWRSRCTMPG